MIEKTLFTKEVICDEVKKHYGIEIKQIQVVNGGSANIYKLLSTEDKQYILKEFQSKYSYQTILKEIHVIDFLKGKGLPVPEYVSCLDGKQYFEYGDKVVIIQNFIEGETRKNYSGDQEQLLESAKYLGMIVNALEEYPYHDMFQCDLKKYSSDEMIDHAIKKHESLITDAKNDKVHGEEILIDLQDKIEMLRAVKKSGIYKQFQHVTVKKTHGDYSVLQFIYDSNGHIKTIIDFVSAGELPIVWEIARSYHYIDQDCRDGKFNIDHLTMYIEEYLKYSKLNKDDLKCLPYVYLAQVLSSAYGYKEYLKNKNLDLLHFGQDRTKMCRYLMDHSENISKRLLKIKC